MEKRGVTAGTQQEMISWGEWWELLEKDGDESGPTEFTVAQISITAERPLALVMSGLFQTFRLKR